MTVHSLVSNIHKSEKYSNTSIYQDVTYHLTLQKPDDFPY